MLRHGLAAFAVTAVLLNLILSDPGRYNPFTLTRLPLTAAPSNLAASLDIYHRARGRPVPVRQLRLLQRLTSLDARMQYAKLGDSALLGCTWCRPNSMDQVAYALVLVSAQYAVLLLGLGLLTADESRARRRSYLVIGVAAGFAYDAFEAIMPHSVASDGTIPMTYERMWRVRRGLAVVLLAVAWWLPPAEQSTAARDRNRALGALSAASRVLETGVGQTQTAGLQRQAVMQTRDLREPVSRYEVASSARTADAAFTDGRILATFRGARLCASTRPCSATPAVGLGGVATIRRTKCDNILDCNACEVSSMTMRRRSPIRSYSIHPARGAVRHGPTMFPSSTELRLLWTALCIPSPFFVRLFVELGETDTFFRERLEEDRVLAPIHTRAIVSSRRVWRVRIRMVMRQPAVRRHAQAIRRDAHSREDARLQSCSSARIEMRPVRVGPRDIEKVDTQERDDEAGNEGHRVDDVVGAKPAE